MTNLAQYSVKFLKGRQRKTFTVEEDHPNEYGLCHQTFQILFGVYGKIYRLGEKWLQIAADFLQITVNSAGLYSTNNQSKSH
jgi:hypothetical protein